VVLYWISRFAFFVQTFFRRVKYITLVNLLTADELFPKDTTPFDPQQPGAEKVLFPEYLTCEDKSAPVAAHVCEWLSDATKRSRRVKELEELRSRVAAGGASSVAADYIVEEVSRRQTLRHRPRVHFEPAEAKVREAA
jgi:lipid-A-disaccharide synthase